MIWDILDKVFEGFTSWVAVVAGLVLLSVNCYLVGEWHWGLTWNLITISLGIGEGLAYLTTKMTLTMRWRKGIREGKPWAKVMAAFWFMFCGVLLGHIVL